MKDKKKLEISLNKVKLSIRNLTKKQKILYVTSFLVVCVITLIFGMYSNFNKRVDNTKLENNVEKKGLSMMLETGRGTGQYEMAIRDKWPTEGYIFNETLSRCENGGTLEWDDVNKTVKVHTSVSDKCYVYFDVEPPDVYIATSNLPSTSTERKIGTINCSSNGATYNQKYNRIEISSINTKYENCTLNYTEQSSKTYLNDYIMGLVGTTQGNGQVVSEIADIPDYSNTSAISETSYTNKSMFSSGSRESNSGTAVSGVFSYSDGKWTSNASSMTSGKYYHFKFTPSKSGYYQMCYELSSGNYRNELYTDIKSARRIQFGLNNFLSASSSSTKTGCRKLGYISHGDYIKVSQYAYDSISTLSFSIKLVQNVKTNADAGTRYEGKDPNNYVWFNNELWRIIGVFDDNSHGKSSEKLVKIIREEPIGTYSWDKAYTSDWSDASLMHILNDYYYSAVDGTDSNYCYISQKVKGNCNFTKNGIISTYRDMVENVVWHYGGSDRNDETAKDFFAYERGNESFNGGKAEISGYVGLLYPSDYGYSVLSSSCARTTEISSYNAAECAGQSWMYGQGVEWTLFPYLYSYDNGRVSNMSYVGVLGFGTTYNSLNVRPVLYLSSKVYIIEGDGSSDLPFVLGMN